MLETPRCLPADLREPPLAKPLCWRIASSLGMLHFRRAARRPLIRWRRKPLPTKTARNLSKADLLTTPATGANAAGAGTRSNGASSADMLSPTAGAAGAQVAGTANFVLAAHPLSPTSAAGGGSATRAGLARREQIRYGYAGKSQNAVILVTPLSKDHFG